MRAMQLRCTRRLLRVGSGRLLDERPQIFGSQRQRTFAIVLRRRWWKRSQRLALLRHFLGDELARPLCRVLVPEAGDRAAGIDLDVDARDPTLHHALD
jgi:hypothetical protein